MTPVEAVKRAEDNMPPLFFGCVSDSIFEVLRKKNRDFSKYNHRPYFLPTPIYPKLLKSHILYKVAVSWHVMCSNSGRNVRFVDSCSILGNAVPGGQCHPPKMKFCSLRIIQGNNLPGNTNREKQPTKGGKQ